MILSIWGETKTCKTTLALTFPTPLLHFEFDPGGFDRAAPRFVEEIQSGAIKSQVYIAPIQYVVKLQGMKELWYKLLADYNRALEDKRIKTIVMDTATQLQQIARAGYLQQLQDKEPSRQKLQQYEYTEPNARMRSIIYAARGHNKNLVLVHFATDDYITRPNPTTGALEQITSGKLVLDGFRETERLVDMDVYCYTTETQVEIEPIPNIKQPDPIPNIKQPYALSPWGVVYKTGIGSIDMVGVRIHEPTHEKIMRLVEMARNAGQVSPASNGG